MEEYSRKCERRADITAAQAIECASCLKATIATRQINEQSDIAGPILQAGGYLSAKELEVINEKHNCSKTCTYHASIHNRIIDYCNRSFTF